MGGVSIIWKKHLPLKIQPVEVDCNRIAAVTITGKNCKLLLINVYMPTDDQSQASFNELGDILDKISFLMASYENFQCVIGGDFNIDINRSSQNVALFKRFLEMEVLLCSNAQFNLGCKFTCESINGTKSVIDHFLYFDASIVKCFDILLEGDNLSDHNPILIEIEFTCNLNNIPSKESFSNAGIDWKKASNRDIELYKTILDGMLSEISVPEELMHCRNFSCKDHDILINKLLKEITNAVKTSADFSIPKYKNCNRKDKNTRIPGWNEYVRPYKESSIILSELWKEAGCITNNQLDIDRKIAKKQYHKAIKYVTNNQESIVREKIASKLKDKKFNDFWAEIKKMKKCKMNYPSVVDDKLGDENVNEVFYNKYRELYNSYGNSSDELGSQYIKERLAGCMSGDCIYNHSVESDMVAKAIKNLKPCKFDPIYFISSSHLINGTNRLTKLLTDVFNLFLSHGFTNFLFNASEIVPIPKNYKKSLSNSNNYRAISMNSVLCKLLEYVLSDVMKRYLILNERQFGYREGISTELCTFMVTETIQYYLNGGSSVYALFLDASKAFDMVNHSKLFKTLIEKNICPLYLRLLMVMYQHNNAKVKWGCSYSSTFMLSNGVKQGGVISPFLFSLYMDSLISDVSSSGLGCHIGDKAMNIFVYADDVVILSPTVIALNKIIKLCEKYSREFNLLFNGEKSEVILFSKFIKSCKSNFFICNKQIKVSDSYKHLGININANKMIDMTDAIRDIKIKSNVIANEFKKQKYETLVKLFNAHCMSLYGCNLWDYTSSDFIRIQVQWRKCIRYVLKLPFRTHNILIPHLIQTEPIETIIHNRFLNFFIRGVNHDNNLIEFMFKNCLLGFDSYFVRNLNIIFEKYDIPYTDIFSRKHFKLSRRDNSQPWKPILIKELLFLRDENLYSNLTRADIDLLIYDLCVF